MFESARLQLFCQGRRTSIDILSQEGRLMTPVVEETEDDDSPQKRPVDQSFKGISFEIIDAFL
jgi:hypothetical protein